MTDDRQNKKLGASAMDDEALPSRLSGGILDALDMAGVGDIDIAFERPVIYSRPATFD